MVLVSLSSAVAMAQTPLHPTDYPTVGDLMNALIQPRHAKLGLAGQAHNWPLADYELHELQQSFGNIGKLHPSWEHLSLPDMFDATVGEPLKALDKAIAAHDTRQFTAAYGALTAACNNCHEAANHRFVHIKPPDGSEFTNQDFAPLKPEP
jgi:hypothetical protein